ncbi:PREDICTED: olfactory receptor 5W2-like, partial [Phaethon lepturus]|uniref:olfactory receptor 5W2-like n=1 Tax=Phaethon lepturus TaxID=97097 RepID=UPI0005309455
NKTNRFLYDLAPLFKVVCARNCLDEMVIFIIWYILNEDVLTSITYTVVTALLKPLVYSLWNKDVEVSLKENFLVKNKSLESLKFIRE